MKKEFMHGAGYTTVYLVVNMNQFVADGDQKKFENVRGTTAFASIIRDEWEKILRGGNSPFSREEQFITPIKNGRNDEARMNVDEVAFNTGIFKGVVLREYSAPFYKVDKSAFDFIEPLRRNWQFKRLFLENWDNWDIHIRPTMTGMFVIRLTNLYDNQYGTQPAEFRTISSNVQNLQASFDIPSAFDVRDDLLAQIDKGIDVEESMEDLDSIQCFLEWLGADENGLSLTMDYPRVQWQLAQEVCIRFLNAIGDSTRLPGRESIEWRQPKKNITSSLNDSYTVYRFNELYAPGRLIQRKQWSREKWKAEQDNLKTITLRDLNNSPRIKESIAQLIEGAMLKKATHPAEDSTGRDTKRFPRQTQAAIDKLFKNDYSSWDDELCLITPGCTVIWPSRKSQDHYLYISTLPTATSQVKYVWYWDAMERMIEFIVEIKLLANLIELKSLESLNKFSLTLNELRLGILEEQTKFELKELADLANEATNLSRLVSLARRLSTPQTWSRAEYAAEKARHFMIQLDIPTLINHAETNVDNMTALINHQDELYLANVSERNTKNGQARTLTLFLISLGLIVYSLPSFWVDTAGLFAPDLPKLQATPFFDLLAVANTTYKLGNLLLVPIGIYLVWSIIQLFRQKSLQSK